MSKYGQIVLECTRLIQSGDILLITLKLKWKYQNKPFGHQFASMNCYCLQNAVLKWMFRQS